MNVHFNMFSALMLDMIARDIYNTDVITIKWCGFRDKTMKFKKQVS